MGHGPTATALAGGKSRAKELHDSQSYSCIFAAPPTERERARETFLAMEIASVVTLRTYHGSCYKSENGSGLRQCQPN